MMLPGKRARAHAHVCERGGRGCASGQGDCACVQQRSVGPYRSWLTRFTGQEKTQAKLDSLVCHSACLSTQHVVRPSDLGVPPGVQQGQFPFVEIVEATAVQVVPSGRESWWNVDGELLANNHLTAEVHRGLVSVFARGIEH